MKYNPETFSYGCELELADVDRSAILPEGCHFDNKDMTVVNSNGIATDPLGKTCKIGGEINVRPTNTIDEQINVIQEIFSSFPIITINYRCNLHIHVRVPGLKDDLEYCKQLMSYIHTYQQYIFDKIEPIPHPSRTDYPSDEAYEGALKRYKRRFRSHQYKVTEDVFHKMMGANTVEEFYNAHAPYSPKKKRSLFHLVPRAGINLRPLWETHHNTIEFRHFPGTTDINEIRSSLEWCREFLNAALNTHETPEQIFAKNLHWKFPEFQPYNHELEKIYLQTSYMHLNRKQIEKNLELLQK